MSMDKNSEFLYEEAEALRSGILRFTVPLGVPLFLLFGVVDIIYQLEDAPFWIAMRLTMALSTLAIAYVLKKNWLNNKSIVLLTASYVVIISNFINIMLYQSGGVASLYLPGVILVQLTFLLVFRFSRSYTLLISASISAPTILILLFSEPVITSTGIILSTFPVCSFLISFFVGHRTDEGYISNIAARHRLNAAEYQSLSYAAIAKTAQMIAHDVRKPFSIITGVIDLIEKSRDSQTALEVAKKYAPVILQAKNHVDVMLNDILAVDKSQENKLAAHELATILQTALQRAFIFDHSSQIALSYRFQHSKLLHCDETKTERILLNLILNAAKAMRGEGTLTFSSRDCIYRGLPFIYLQVHNTNSYIAPDRAERVFSSFFSERIGGVGLGLTICRKFVEEQGGSISCQSDQKTGTSFDFYLPAAPACDAQKKGPVISSPELPSSSIYIASPAAQGSAEPYWAARLRKASHDYRRAEPGERLGIRLAVYEDEAFYDDFFSALLRTNPGLAAIVTYQFISNNHLALAGDYHADLAIVDIDLGKSQYSGMDVIDLLAKRDKRGIICAHSDRGFEDFHELIAKRAIDYFVPKPMHEEQFFRILCLTLEAKLATATPPRLC